MNAQLIDFLVAVATKFERLFVWRNLSRASLVIAESWLPLTYHVLHHRFKKRKRKRKCNKRKGVKVGVINNSWHAKALKKVMGKGIKFPLGWLRNSCWVLTWLRTVTGDLKLWTHGKIVNTHGSKLIQFTSYIGEIIRSSW